MLTTLIDTIKKHKKLTGQTDGRHIRLTGCHGSSKAYAAARLFNHRENKAGVLAVFPSHKDAVRFMDDMRFFMPDRHNDILYFPGYHIKAYKSLSYHGRTAASRMEVLYRVSEKSRTLFVITTLETLLQRIIPSGVLTRSGELVMAGEEIDRDLLVAKLNSGGYTRTSLVEEPGDYAVRGGVMDVFSPNYGEPVRIELFGDFVESLRHFSPVTQRSLGDLGEAVIIPTNEVVVEKGEIPSIITRLRKAGSDSGLDGVKINGYVERIREEGRFPGMESMLSIVYPELDTLMDYFPGDTLLIMDRPDQLKRAAEEFFEHALENYDNTKREQRLCVEAASIYMKWDQILEKTTGWPGISFMDIPFLEPRVPGGYSSPEPGGEESSSLFYDTFKDGHEMPSTLPVGEQSSSLFHADLKDNSALSLEMKNHGLEPLARWFTQKRDSGMAAVAVCSSTAQAGRLNSLLQPYGIEPVPWTGLNPPGRSVPGIYYIVGNISSGFEDMEGGLALVTDQEIFGAAKRPSMRRARQAGMAKNRFMAPEELKEGDIVVHMEHGLGRYDGLCTITIDGMSGDFILITYRDDDRLYLPVDRMEMVEKYVGVEGYTPLLDKIGGKTWTRAKAKAKKEVEKMAGELLKLYAERKVVKGHAFSSGDTLYDDFQASFPYEETPDQLRAIEDVLSDMEDETPMDRLVCGDVGYGKTEVALRGAFKSVNDGRQVAVVVPTTILAEQHLHTFRERFKKWPVSIEALSRFRSRGEQARILKAMARGTVDIVIGTHRLLQKDVEFKALGLLVIDEEQRFGVKHKETLKKKRSNVDVLALTATPIPRTLHLSLTGMRDISVIATPPGDRRAIISYISRYDDAIAVDAVKNELARGGQIFFIHNDIATINEVASRMQRLIPKLRLAVAHGRLPESSLEKVMLKFINREIDMLVCTTIVESGLDIPAANTMIINRADRFGLSQIYQLRGRIGRGDEQAYAYLFVPDENRLPGDARKRLAALMEHRDLGSGFQIAMKDLQIRGSGSALGASQSGHIAAVGYDMFLKLLDEAVSAIKGKPVIEPLEPEINVTMSAHIPEDYVQSIEQRLTIYRRLSQMTEVAEITAMQGELVDRFGKLPEAAANMLLKIMLRVLGIRAGVKKMDITPSTILLVFSELHQKRPLRITGDMDQVMGRVINGWPVEYTAENALKITLWPRNKKISRALLEARKILKEISIITNG
ncbi:MAG: transcription-repair coupling factor [Desulfamplus sp.]|nr:transcription-repair coupling factor [Desulfamplus sp.]